MSFRSDDPVSDEYPDRGHGSAIAYDFNRDKSFMVFLWIKEIKIKILLPLIKQ